LSINIQKIVRKLIKKYKTNNPFELADYLNCTVIVTELDERVRGFYQHFQRNKLIYINNNLTELEQRIVCSHELGHAVLHTKLNILFLENNTYFVKNKYEIEANTFAAELLIDNEILKQYQHFTIDQIAASENIPKDLIELKFKDLSIF
jgi:Predicted Zn peptidase